MRQGYLQRNISTLLRLTCFSATRMIWTIWKSALLFISITQVHGHSNFPENLVLARKGDDPVLTCNASAGKAVTWKFDGNDLENTIIETSLTDDGLRLTVLETNVPVGEYSCWSEGQMLSSHSLYLLLEDKDLDFNSSFHCWARSYDCSFTCTWSNSAYTAEAVRVGLGPECTNGLKSCQWVSSSSPLAGGGFLFSLSHSLPPYAEEKTMMQVTAEVLINESVIRKTNVFFLREIIKPDSPRIVKCEKMDQKMKVIIEPPPTWSSPHSFFTLEHQIEYVLKDDGKTESTSSTLIPLTISRLRVRSRDSLLLSSWSDWSNWKNEPDFL